MNLRWLLSRARSLHGTLAYSGFLPRAWRSRQIELFWERQAPSIYAKWGKSRHDVGVVGRILETYRPASVLDVGCGTGRLFDLYRAQGVREIAGVDIAAAALARAHREHPDISTTQVPLQRAEFPRRFDLIVSNRVLQHIPRTDIDSVVQKLTAAARFIYLNELSDSDGVPDDCSMVRHDYQALFGVHGWRTLERGQIGTQTYLLLAAPTQLSQAELQRLDIRSGTVCPHIARQLDERPDREVGPV
jgi:SAM-dependent methyltransferase